jgi:hypothetical protein
MFLTARIRAGLVAAAAVIVTRSAVAAEPTPTTSECITASESGQDLRHAGKLRDARGQFAICVAASCPGPIREDCMQRLDEVGKAMPSIIFELKDTAGNDVVGVTIMTGGQRLAASAGTVIELDPGEHTFTFQAQGHPMVEKRLMLAEGVHWRREVLVIADGVDRRRELTSKANTSEPAPMTSAPSKGDVAPRPNGPPALAWVAFGVGGAGLTLGIVAGLVAGGKHSTLAGECDNDTQTCAPQYAGDLDAFHTWRTVSTIGYVVGALGAVGGAALWLTAPKVRTNAAHLWLGPASAGIAGRF